MRCQEDTRLLSSFFLFGDFWGILGITWLLMIIYVILKKQLLLLHKIDKRMDKSHQLETQSSEQHYDDLQDTDIDKNYTALDRTNQETLNDETL